MTRETMEDAAAEIDREYREIMGPPTRRTTMNLEDLKAPFYASEIEWRIGRCGLSGERVWATVLAYVTNRAIMDRLDSVCGPANWKNEFKPHPCADKALLCGISVKVDGEWVTKWDGADSTDIEAAKGVISDSMKRAAVQWGIGRFLYNLDEGFLDDAHISLQKQSGWTRAKTKEGKMFWWCPPELPEWALPPSQPKPDGQTGNGKQQKQQTGKVIVAEPLRTTLVEVFKNPPPKQLAAVVSHLTEGLHSMSDVGDPAVAVAVHEALLTRHSQKQTWQQIHAEATKA